MESLEPNEIFVFGSNEAGRHGRGAAKFAKRFGARNGVGIGLSGQTYAIPTKDHRIRTLPLGVIRQYVKDFLQLAAANSDVTFLVTEIGCGLAGYTPPDIAPMFAERTANVVLPQSFENLLP